MDTTHHLWLRRKLGERCVQALQKHAFEARFIPTIDEARTEILNQISGYETFGFGGSVSIRDLGLVDELVSMGKTVFDHWVGDLSKEEDMDLRLRQGRCDCFISSANAVSATGEIVNVDGVGNRTNAMTFGTKQVVIVAGMNKVTHDLESALRRVKEVAAPMRAKSLDLETPCAETGVCHDCNSPQRICRVTSILHRSPLMSHISVVLINQDLGY